MKYVLGIDVGGTSIKAGIFTLEGQLKAVRTIPTSDLTTPQAFAEVTDGLTNLVSSVDGAITDVEAVGLDIPGPVDANGNVGFLPNIKLDPDGLKNALKETFFQARLAFVNDANAAALGEMWMGGAKGVKNFIMITLGTGVGSGIVINGQIVYGSDGFAGELGHVIMVRENGRSCGCGRNGCLEAYCSATGVARTAREFLKESAEPSLLRDMKPEDITSLDVSLAAAKGDKLSKRVYEFTGEMLGEACADFATFSSPEAFVFFGGLTKAGDLLMKPLERSYRKHALAIFRDKPKFLVSSLDGASAAVLGASAVGWDL